MELERDRGALRSGAARGEGPFPPLLPIIGDADFELRRINNGRAFYSLIERGAKVEIQMYPMARRAFDFRNDATPEEKIAARHARERVREWLVRHMRLGADGRCK